MQKFLRKHSQGSVRCAVLWLVLVTAGAAFGDNTKISPDLQPLLANPSNQINVIVQYNSAPQQSSGGLLGGLLGGVLNLLGGVLNTVFSLIPAVSATLHPSDVIGLSNQSNVAYISLDRSLAASLDYSAAAVNASTAWTSGLDGSGIGIAVIDSGIYNHPDLNASNSTRSRVVYRQSFIGGTLSDDFGHGTHVAGIVAGNGSSSSKPGAFQTFKGIAPNANLIDLRVLDQNGMSNDSVVIAAIQEAVQLKSKYNVRVINLSLGRPIYEGCTKDPLCQAVEAAWKSGIVVVTAAGNLGRNGYATVLSPGNSPHAITVGAMKTEFTFTAHGRSDRQLQLPWTDLHRPHRQARRSRAGKSGGLAAGSRIDAGERLPGQYPGHFAVHDVRRSGAAALFPAERHQHGDPGRFRRSRADA